MTDRKTRPGLFSDDNNDWRFVLPGDPGWSPPHKKGRVPAKRTSHVNVVLKAPQDPDAVLRRRLYQTVVTVKVGPSEKMFYLERDILISRSEYFKTSLTSGFVEARTSIVTLDDADENIFCIACVWMYENRFALVAENQDEALRALRARYKDQTMRADSPDHWPWRLFLDLYIFADRYRISDMKKEVVACLGRSSIEPDPSMIITAYEELPPDSALFKESLIDHYISLGKGPATREEFDQLSPDFVFQILNNMFKTSKQK